MAKLQVNLMPGFQNRLHRFPKQDQEFIGAMIELLEAFQISRKHAIRLMKEIAVMLEVHTREGSHKESPIINPNTGRPYG